MTFSCAPVQL